MNRRNKKLVLLVMTFIMICSIFFQNNLIKSDDSQLSNDNISILTTHAPISISGDVNFTEVNGVKDETALGTKNDPFIIEYWEITSTTNGIEIQDTRAHVTIQHCELTRPEISGIGIRIENATNVIVQNCTINKHFYGIYLEDVNDTIISDNKINFSSWGIRVINIFNSTMNFNHINGMENSGIRAELSNTCNISNNHIENCSDALNFWHADDFNITENYCHHNTECAVVFNYGCNTNNFTLNTFVRNYEYAFHLHMTQDNHIHHNDLSLNGLGAIYYATGWTDIINDNTLNHSNEMLMESLPSITYENSSTVFCRIITLNQFMVSTHPHELVFKIAYQRHLDGNATIHMKASVYTIDGYYVVSSTGEFIFDANMTHNESDYVSFDYESDSTGFVETSYELYHFPMCAQNVSESLNATTLNISLIYDCWGSEWSSMKSNLFLVINVPKYQPSSGGGNPLAPPIPGFSFVILLFTLISILLLTLGARRMKFHDLEINI